jgi:small subunit ribosomal protein S14
MAKKSAIEKNNRRKKMSASHSARRAQYKAIIMDRNASPEDRFQATLSLAKMPRNGAKIRVRNRCEVSGRPRGYYRKFKISRIALRDLVPEGVIPGVSKSSW